MVMKWYPLFIVSIIALVLSGCSDHARTEFETASGMLLPAELKEEESYDDGKFVKTSSFQAGADVLNSFIGKNNFEKFTILQVPQFWGINYLKEKPDLNNISFFYFKSGSSENISWICIADMKTNRLWTEIKYPGKAAY